MPALARRAITIPGILLATALLTLAAPVWLPLAWLLGRLWAPARSAAPALAFILWYLWCETVGLLVAAFLRLRHGRPRSPGARRRWLEANYALQSWWCRALKRGAEALFRLRFEVEGSETLGGDGAILMPRHCSIGDTLIPVVFYGDAHGRRLRFVLKRELLWDPCLDVVGNRLPNYFADRGSEDTARETAGVAELLGDLPPEHGVLIYPEGTRFGEDKRARILERLEARGATETLAFARRWTRLLPPRFGGPLALLGANPGRDLVFCAHTGFEGSSDFRGLLNGSWSGTVVRIRFRRVPFAAIPSGEEDRRLFLLEQWDRMHRDVEALERASTTADDQGSSSIER